MDPRKNEIGEKKSDAGLAPLSKEENSRFFCAGDDFILDRNDLKQYQTAMINPQPESIGMLSRVMNSAAPSKALVAEMQKKFSVYADTKYQKSLNLKAMDKLKGKLLRELLDENGELNQVVLDKISMDREIAKQLVDIAKMVLSLPKNSVAEQNGDLKPWVEEFLGKTDYAKALEMFKVEDIRRQLMCGIMMRLSYALLDARDALLLNPYDVDASISVAVSMVGNIVGKSAKDISKLMSESELLDQFLKKEELVIEGYLEGEAWFISFATKLHAKSVSNIELIERNPLCNVAAEMNPVIAVVNKLFMIKKTHEGLYGKYLQELEGYIKQKANPLTDKNFKKWLSEVSAMCLQLAVYQSKLTLLNNESNHSKEAEQAIKCIQANFTNGMKKVKSALDATQSLVQLSQSLVTDSFVHTEGKVLAESARSFVQPRLESLSRQATAEADLSEISLITGRVVYIVSDKKNQYSFHTLPEKTHPNSNRFYQQAAKQFSGYPEIKEIKDLDNRSILFAERVRLITAVKEYDEAKQNLEKTSDGNVIEKSLDAICADTLEKLEKDDANFSEPDIHLMSSQPSNDKILKNDLYLYQENDRILYATKTSKGIIRAEITEKDNYSHFKSLLAVLKKSDLNDEKIDCKAKEAFLEITLRRGHTQLNSAQFKQSLKLAGSLVAFKQFEKTAETKAFLSTQYKLAIDVFKPVPSDDKAHLKQEMDFSHLRGITQSVDAAANVCGALDNLNQEIHKAPLMHNAVVKKIAEELHKRSITLLNNQLEKPEVAKLDALRKVVDNIDFRAKRAASAFRVKDRIDGAEARVDEIDQQNLKLINEIHDAESLDSFVNSLEQRMHFMVAVQNYERPLDSLKDTQATHSLKLALQARLQRLVREFAEPGKDIEDLTRDVEEIAPVIAQINKLNEVVNDGNEHDIRRVQMYNAARVTANSSIMVVHELICQEPSPERTAGLLQITSSMNTIANAVRKPSKDYADKLNTLSQSLPGSSNAWLKFKAALCYLGGTLSILLGLLLSAPTFGGGGIAGAVVGAGLFAKGSHYLHQGRSTGVAKDIENLSGRVSAAAPGPKERPLIVIGSEDDDAHKLDDAYKLKHR